METKLSKLSVDQLLDHIKSCAELWEVTEVSRVRAITRSVEEIREALRFAAEAQLDAECQAMSDLAKSERT